MSALSEKKEGQPNYEFVLKILAVKMKIKFPCRMALEHNKQIITKEVPSGQGNKFLFNEEITLKGEGDGQTFEVLANLFTDKGTRYTSGIMKLLGAELMRSQGERLVIPLAKCLDPDAFCEIKVENVNNLSKSQLKLSKTSSKVLNSSERPELLSPETRKINSERYLIGETRSEVNFQQLGAGITLGSEEGKRDGPKSQIFKTFTKSPNNKFSQIKYVTYNGGFNGAKNQSEFPGEEITSQQRDKFAQSQVYKQGYQKLKEKYKKEAELAKEQAHKRMMLQTNENNYKLEIMKMKLKAEQQEKLLADRNEKIKTISNSLIELQKKDLDLAYLKEECNNLERKLSLSEETIVTLTKDNESLKKLMGEKSAFDQETIRSLRQELQLANSKVEQLRYEYDLQVKAKDNIILAKATDVKLRNDTIQRQKKLVKQLEEQAEAKLFEFEKSLNSQRNAFQVKFDELKAKTALIQGEKNEQISKVTSLSEDIIKLQATIAKMQYREKVSKEETTMLTNEISELKIVKDKYIQLQKEHGFLEEQFETVRRNLELSLQNKQVNINELLSKYEEGKVRYDKTKGELEDKVKLQIMKIQELEATIEIHKNNQQKSKRLNDNLTKENTALREQNSLLRNQLKSAEKRIISLEGQYNSHTSRYERETISYKSLSDKYRDQKSWYEKENDSLKDKIEKLEQIRKDYEEKETTWKNKQRHYDEKLEKEQIKYKDTISKYEQIIKDHQATISESTTLSDSLSNQNRALKRKINDEQLATIKSRQTLERVKKDVKLAEEKINGLQNHLKSKIYDIQTNQEKINLLEMKLQDKEQDFVKSKEQHAKEVNNRQKQDKMIEILNQQIAAANKNVEEFTLAIKVRQTEESRLREEIKLNKDELAKEKMRATKIESDFDKFKESINDIIRIQFTRILNTPTSTQKNTERLRQSQVSSAKSDKSLKQKLDSGTLSTTLVERLHETKTSLWKMAELNRILKHENSRLIEQSESQNNKYQFVQLEYQRDIQLLEDEMDNVINDKEEEYEHYDNMLGDMNYKIKEREATIEELRINIIDYEDMVKGLKEDFEANNRLNDKKVSTLNANINELNDKINYLNLNIACLEDKNHQLQEKTIEQENEIISHKEMLIKNEKSLIDVKENEAKLIREFDLLKKEYKSLQEAHSEQELLLNTEKETKEKYILMLEEEEKKSHKLNEFISGLIVQKETVIKKELERSEQVNSLENKVFELTHERDLLAEQNEKNKKKIEQSKQQIKNLTKNVKSLEKQLAEQKAKGLRSLEKIRERESDLEIKREYIKDLQEKYRELRDKNYKEIRQLSNELDDKNLVTMNISKQLNEKILKVQNENKKIWEENQVLKNDLEELTKQVYHQKDTLKDLELQHKSLQEEKISVDEELASREFVIQEKGEEIKKLEQLVQEQTIQISNLVQQYESNEKQFNNSIEELTHDYNFKLEDSAREFQQKIELLSKQNESLKEKLKTQEQQLAKTQIAKKSQQIDHEQSVKNYEDKIKKVQSQRLANILSKNSEINKIAEDCRNNFDKLKEKEAQLRKVTLQLEQARQLVSSIKQTSAQSQEQNKNREKLLEKEIATLRIKEQQNIANREKLLTTLHQNETEVRNLISKAIKQAMEKCQNTDSEKLYAATKGLQSSVASAMMRQLDNLNA